MLKQIGAGTKCIGDSFEKIDLWFITNEKGIHYVDAFGKSIVISSENEEEFVAIARRNNPNAIVSVSRISQEEYIEIAKILEESC